MRRHSLRVLGGLSFGVALLLAACSEDSADTASTGGASGQAGAAGSAAGAAGKAGGQSGAGQAGMSQAGAGQGGAGQGGAAGASAGAAGQAGAAGGTVPLFVLPASLDELGQGCSADGFTPEDDECASSFFDHPFPSDFRRDEQGRVRWANFVNPRLLATIKLYTSTADRLLTGFSPQAAGFLRFAGPPLDATGLPASPGQSVGAGSSVQLIDVDEASPGRGQRHPISIYYREKHGLYWGPSTLAWAPAPGLPLRPGTRYALVVTRDLKAAGGAEIGHSAELDGVLGLGPASAAAGALAASWKGALDAVAAAGVARDRIAHLAVFTTDDPTSELLAIRDDVRASVEAPKAKDWVVGPGSNPTHDIYEGNYGPSPDYQTGNIPFAKPSDGGAFTFEGGKPVLQRTFDLRFALATPSPTACPMPAAGYPIVLYAHGTGGDYRSFIDDGTASALAERCVASMGIDQIFHGTRPGAPTGPDAGNKVALLFFNVDNPVAARTNGRQAAVDEVQRARLFTETKIAIPAAVSKSGQEIRFDPAKVMFFGHSQGGQNGPLYLAIDDSARGGVLSGSGGDITITLLEKTLPAPSVAQLVKTVFLGLKANQYEELNLWHPALALAQTLVDSSDPINYARLIVREPRAGYAPKSIYQTEGIGPDGVGDSYTPPRSIEVLAVAMGLPQQQPFIRPIPEMSLVGLAPVTVPAAGLAGNLASGKASGVLAQWDPPSSSDGHFVVFDVPAARSQAAQFCRNLADEPAGRVPAP